MSAQSLSTAAHALLSVWVANGIDRVFVVPGESYLGVLDALYDFPQIDVVTCRHEAGAGFMACADGRLTRRPGVLMVSRGPGASNAAIAVHTAQQDAIPLILLVGQVPRAHLRRESFQEIDYQKMYGAIAKWVFEVNDARELPEVAFKALRVATAESPGPVVIVLPEDVQETPLTSMPDHWIVPPASPAAPSAQAVERLRDLLTGARQPLIVAGGSFDVPGGREALFQFAHAWQVPVALSFRRQDIFAPHHPLYVGDLGLANPERQLDAFHSADLIVALGTRMGDITTQGYTFPTLPRPQQTFVHCFADGHFVGRHYATDLPLVCDPLSLVRACLPAAGFRAADARRSWATRLRRLHDDIAQWPPPAAPSDEPGVIFVDVVRALLAQATPDMMICLDAGTFAAPVYRHFPFAYPQRLMAPLAGAMGYGVPAAIAAQLRHPRAQVVCMVGDGGFLMTGNEMILAVARELPIVFIVSNNDCYGSIRLHQQRHHPGRYVGTGLNNPDFVRLADAFGMRGELVEHGGQIEAALTRALSAQSPYLLEVRTRLAGAPPRGD